MEVRYRNTLDHLAALQKFFLGNSRTGKKMMLHRFLAVEAIIVFITIIFAINHNRLKVLLGFAIVSGLAWMFRKRAVVQQFKKDFKRERRKDNTGLFDKDRIITIAPEGFNVRLGDEITDYPWDEVEATGRDRKHLFIVLTGVLHYVIPLTAFSDENQAEKFLETIASYRSQAE